MTADNVMKLESPRPAIHGVGGLVTPFIGIKLVVFTVIVGVAYPLVVTAIGQVGFKGEANGSLVNRQGAPVGSRLIGQPVPVDAVTTLASGLDPEISPANARLQAPRDVVGAGAR